MAWSVRRFGTSSPRAATATPPTPNTGTATADMPGASSHREIATRELAASSRAGRLELITGHNAPRPSASEDAGSGLVQMLNAG